MKNVRTLAVPVLFGAAGLLLAHHELLLSGFDLTQFDPGDTRFCNYLLEHGHRWWTGHPAHRELWSPPYFFPATTNVLAFAENMLGGLPFYSPWRLLGFSVETAFQLWILTVSALNFLSMYLLLRRPLAFSQLAAAAGACLFAYAGMRINQTMHYQLFPQCFSIASAYAVARLFGEGLSERARVGWIWVFFGGVVGQLYASIYLGWFLGFGLLVAGLLGLALPASRRTLFSLLRQHPYTLVLASLASAAVLYPVMSRYGAVGKQFGMRPFEEALTMIPEVRAWFHMGPYSWFYGGLARLPVFRGIPMEHEQRLGLGLFTTVAALAGSWMGRKQRSVLFVGLLGAAVFLVTTRYGAVVPWKVVYDYVPGAGSIRAVSRIGLVLLLPVGVGVAALVESLYRRGAQFVGLAAVVGAFCVVEQGETTPAFSKRDHRRDVADIAKAVPPGCKGFLFSPMQGVDPYWKYQLDAMFASLETGVPTLNGYSGHNPEGWPFTDTNIHGAEEEARVGYLLQQWASPRGLDVNDVCWARVGLQQGPHRAEFVGQNVPAAMVAGQTYPVALTFRNVGTDTWPAGRGLRLGSQAPRDNSRWGGNRVELPHDVAPGQTVTFTLPLRAPAESGRHAFQWRMVREGMLWFGQLSERVDVEVAAVASPPPSP